MSLNGYQRAAAFGRCPTPRASRRSDGELIDTPCGQCWRCLRAKQDGYCGRMLGEMVTSGGGTFLTLTLNDQSLASRDWETIETWRNQMSLLLRRLAYQDGSGVRPKYWWVAERGKEKERPHAHMIVFGPSNIVRRERMQTREWWPYGFVDLGPLTPGGAKYQAKYLAEPEKVDLLIGKGKSHYLGETAFRLFCDLVRERWERWGEHHLPPGPVWSVEHRFYPMDLRFQQIYKEEYGLPYGPSPMGRASELLRFEAPTVAKDMIFQEYRRGLQRKREVDAVFDGMKRPSFVLNGYRVKL